MINTVAPLDPIARGRDTSDVAQRMGCPEFVGRNDSVAVLRDAYQLAHAGKPSMVLIGGDAGMGKTRLVSEFCAQAPAGASLVATGSCVPIEGGGLPYAAIIGILRDLSRQLGEDAAAGPLGTLVPRLESAPHALHEPDAARAGRGGLADALAKTHAFESILSCLTTLAEQTPLIVVFEDLQWADSASAELLRFLTRNLVDSRLLIIGTYRSEELGRDHPLRSWLSELGRQSLVSHLRLEGLDRDQTARLIEGILGAPPDWALVDGVWARSQGNPFFAEELTAARHSPTLSAELRDVIMTRVESLSPESQHLLQVVAASGAVADHHLVAEVSPLDDDALDRAFGEVVDRQILIVDPDRATYSFRHALLREAVYAALLPGERDRLHRRLGAALTENPSLGPTDPGQRSAELAAHWWAAGEWADAYRESVSSARAATLVWAFPEAHAHLERAVSALDRMAQPAAADRLAVVEEAADIAYLAGDSARSVELAQQALELVDAAAEPAHAARLCTILGRNTWGIGDSTAAFEAYRRAAELLPADSPSIELALALAEESRGLMMMSRLHESQRRCHEAIEVARAVGSRAVEGHALNTLGCCVAMLGDTDEGIALVREALEVAETLAGPDDLNRAYGNLSGLLLSAGRLEEAAALVFDSAAAGEELWGVGLESTVTNSAEVFIRLGRYDEAAAILAKVGLRGLGACAASPDMERMTIELRRGRLDAADDLRRRIDELTAGLSDVQQRGTFHMLSAELALEQERPDEAYAQIEQALGLAATTDDEETTLQMAALGVRALAEQLVDAGSGRGRLDPDKLRLQALELSQHAAQLLKDRVDRGGDVPARFRALPATCEAERSRMHTPDPELWARAAQHWEAAGEPYPHAYCLWRRADAVLQQRVGRAAATACLQQAGRISREIGARSLTEHIELLARRARILLVDAENAPANGSTVAGDLGLTPREVEVLAQLARGHTDREIADALFISKKTASVHVSNLLRKLDVANRVEAGRIGQTHLG